MTIHPAARPAMTPARLAMPSAASASLAPFARRRPVPATAALLLGAALVGAPQGVFAMPAALSPVFSPVFAEGPSPAVLPAGSCEVEPLRCSCFTNPDPAVQHAEWVERAELVVRVTVLEVDPLASSSNPPPAGLPSLQDPRFARLRVEERWKGAEHHDHVSLYVGDAHIRTSCDLSPRPGEALLLYARWNERLEAWITTVCAGTTSVERARARGDMDRLGPGTPAP